MTRFYLKYCNTKLGFGDWEIHFIFNSTALAHFLDNTSVFVKRGKLKVWKVIHKTRSFIGVAPLELIVGVWLTWYIGLSPAWLAQATKVIEEKPDQNTQQNSRLQCTPPLFGLWCIPHRIFSLFSPLICPTHLACLIFFSQRLSKTC